MTAPVVQWIE